MQLRLDKFEFLEIIEKINGEKNERNNMQRSFI